MKLIILSILFTLIQSNRLLQTLPDCSTIRCGSGGPCFDNPYTNTPRCCPANEICSSNDYYQDTTMVICSDGNTYDNKCYGFCAGNKPKDCQPICKCNPGNNDCSFGYECLQTPIGFARCDEKITDSCFGFCVSTGEEKRSCGGVVGISACNDNEQCFYTEIFPSGGIGYCGSLPNQCKKPVGCTKDAKICPDGSTVGRIPPNCEFEKCPTPNYCNGLKNCKQFFDGCNECSCNSNICTKKACDPRTLQRPYCMECNDGYQLNYEYGQCELKTDCTADVKECTDGSFVTRDPNNYCQFKDCPKQKPVCGGFKNCEIYHDGCTQCRCGDACYSFNCPPVIDRPEPKCIQCNDGYELNEYGECKKCDTPDDTCPVTQPMSGDKCNFKGSCYYGKEYCCGQKFDKFGCDCLDGNTICYYTDDCIGAPEKCDQSSTTEGPIIVEPVYCPLDVKECPGGMSVNRNPNNNCEFPKCPVIPEPTLNICADGTICSSEDICYDTSNGPICCGPDECSRGPSCGGFKTSPCKPDYNCVNDPTIPCIYGKDADCPGVCLWIKPTCNDITCKGNDICYQLNNGPICCDPEICASTQKCDEPQSCEEEYGLIGYECVDNPLDSHFPCDWRNDFNCAGICVNPNAEPEPETTKTGPVNSLCPFDRPNPGDKCDFEGICFYGQESCCGQTFDSFGCTCDIDGQTACFNTDFCLGAPQKCNIKPPIMCQQDSKPCDDGTYVSRDPNNDCQFPKCPPKIPIKTYATQIPPQIPTVGTCCNQVNRPIGCIEGSACCPDGSWTCGIGDGGFSCGGHTLYPNEDTFGKICGISTLPPNNGKVSCKKYSDCDMGNGYKCYPDPLCKANGGNSCSDQKVCMSSGGTCNSNSECEMYYKCISVTKTIGFCVKYQ